MMLQGDGIGPEIMRSAKRILSVLSENFNIKIEGVPYNIGVRTVNKGEWNLDMIIDEAKQYKAILKAQWGI